MSLTEGINNARRDDLAHFALFESKVYIVEEFLLNFNLEK